MNADEPPVSSPCYRFTVKTAEEAAALIREKLGPRARVLSVRNVEVPGLRRLWSAPRLEVIAQLEPEPASASALPPPADAAAAEERSAARPGAPASLPRFPRSAASARESNLPSLLRRSGLSDLALGRLQADARWPEFAALPLHRALVEIGLHLRQEAEGRRRRRPLARAAFLGTPGSGRSTALCKWLGAEVFRRGRMGHVVAAEFDRPNPAGPLPVFCEALGVPVARFPASTQPAVGGGFVYFDLPGIALRDPAENAALSNFLERERIEERVLVLNAAYDHSTLRTAYAAGRDLGATHLVFTHLDEVRQWGRLWDYLSDGALEPLFLATGPSLTGDCEEDVWSAIIRRTLAADDDSTPAEPSSSPDDALAASPA